MNIELILWIVAFIISMETFFVILLKLEYFEDDSWIYIKIFSFLLMAGFFLVQIGLVFGVESPILENSKYINLLYEAIIILGITLFFYINKYIARRKLENENNFK